MCYRDVGKAFNFYDEQNKEFMHIIREKETLIVCEILTEKIKDELIKKQEKNKR